VSKTEKQPPDFFAFVPSQIEAGRPYDSVLRDSPSASCPAESGMTASHSSVCTAKLFWKPSEKTHGGKNVLFHETEE
jgi:hypothetical protein